MILMLQVQEEEEEQLPPLYRLNSLLALFHLPASSYLTFLILSAIPQRLESE